MKISKEEYKDFYDRVGRVSGWNFGEIRHTSEGVKWDLYGEMLKRSKKTDLLLDVGTGGGEKILKIAKNLQFIVAIDTSDGMIETAKKNLARSRLKNVRFFLMDGEDVQFPDEMFDIISCRHSDFSPTENYRLLVDGGLFITQQVGEGDKLNIKDFFGRGQEYGVEDGTEMKRYVKELKKAGFSHVESHEYNAKEHYERPEDLINLLKNAPIIMGFGSSDEDFDKLDGFIKQATDEKGIITNSKRYMIIARK